MACYSELVRTFLNREDIDALEHKIENGSDGFPTSAKQWDVWKSEIAILQSVLRKIGWEDARIIFEYTIPRIRLRLDVVLLYGGQIFVLEFKGHEKEGRRVKKPTKKNKDQVERYAKYLSFCQSLSSDCRICPILVTVDSPDETTEQGSLAAGENVFGVSCANQNTLAGALKNLYVDVNQDAKLIDWRDRWVHGGYNPSPNIVESTINRFRNHHVDEIRQTGAAANDLAETTLYINNEIAKLKENGGHAIFFVTGVPGAGKTLVGLDVVATNLEDDIEKKKRHGATFLSGNMPLVEVLSAALARDAERFSKADGIDIVNDYKTMVNHMHSFKEDVLPRMRIGDDGRVMSEIGDRAVERTIEHLVVFDEAQRAFDKEKFTQKGQYQRENTILQDPRFPFSQPGFMLWSLSQHKDWSAIVCLVGGGQEINEGESGICEWFKSLNCTGYDFLDQWYVHVSPELTGEEYGGTKLRDLLDDVEKRGRLKKSDCLNLKVPKRSKSSELTRFVERLLGRDIESKENGTPSLKDLYMSMTNCEDTDRRFLLYRTRSVESAKTWLRTMRDASGSHPHGMRKERAGLLMSSNGYRLRPLGFPALTQATFDATASWFLDGKEKIGSSDFLEIALHEMFVQGLELDWVGLLWDADFRPSSTDCKSWDYYSRIIGCEWSSNKNAESRRYQFNAYRVLLTRARKGMVIIVPEGDKAGNDSSRNPDYYQGIYDYLGETGIQELPI